MIRRGEVWWALLPAPVGSEPGGRRPVLVVQTDEYNKSELRTVVVVTFTTNLRLAGAPGNVLCPKGYADMPKESVINVSQVATVNRTRLTARIGKLPWPLMQEVETGMRRVLGL